MKNKKGFTLVELIVVIAIVAVVTAIAIPSVFGIINSAKKSAAMEDTRSMYTILNQRMAVDEGADTDLKLLYRWTDGNGGVIKYIGVNDNSVTLNNGSYHDIAKKTVQKMMNTDTLKFGYRLYLKKESDGTHTVQKIEVFYKKPANANITSATGDFIIDNTNAQ